MNKAFLLGVLLLIVGAAVAEITPNFPEPKTIFVTEFDPTYNDGGSTYNDYEFEVKLVVDDFSVTNSVVEPFIIDSNTPYGEEQFVADQVSNVLGGERDIIVQYLSGAGGTAVLAAAVSDDEFVIQAPNNAAGKVFLQYDGLDSNRDLDSQVGLSGVDFTAEGTAFAIQFSISVDVGTDFILTICSEGGVCAEIEDNVPAAPGVFTDYLVEYEEINASNPNIDLTQVSAIEFEFDLADNVDLVLSQIEVIGNIVGVTIGADGACDRILPCQTNYYRIETLEDIQVNDYLKIFFNQTGEAGFESELGSLYIVASDFDNLENELQTNNNIVAPCFVFSF